MAVLVTWFSQFIQLFVRRESQSVSRGESRGVIQNEFLGFVAFVANGIVCCFGSVINKGVGASQTAILVQEFLFSALFLRSDFGDLFLSVALKGVVKATTLLLSPLLRSHLAFRRLISLRDANVIDGTF